MMPEKAPKVTVTAGVAALFFASLAAGLGWVRLSGIASLTCGPDRIIGGANIGHALLVAGVGGLAASALLIVTRRRQRLVTVVFLLAALDLSAAIILVAADSATQIEYVSCVTFFGSGPETRHAYHVEILYILWGVPLGLLLWAAGERVPSFGRRGRSPAPVSRGSDVASG